MVITSLDYERFADAAGIEYPATAAEKARLAPAVAAWKQQVADEQRSAVTPTEAAIYAGLLTAGGLGGYGLWNSQWPSIQEPTVPAVDPGAAYDSNLEVPAEQAPQGPIATKESNRRDGLIEFSAPAPGEGLLTRSTVRGDDRTIGGLQNRLRKNPWAISAELSQAIEQAAQVEGGIDELMARVKSTEFGPEARQLAPEIYRAAVSAQAGQPQANFDVFSSKRDLPLEARDGQIAQVQSPNGDLIPFVYTSRGRGSGNWVEQSADAVTSRLTGGGSGLGSFSAEELAVPPSKMTGQGSATYFADGDGGSPVVVDDRGNELLRWVQGRKKPQVVRFGDPDASDLLKAARGDGHPLGGLIRRTNLLGRDLNATTDDDAVTRAYDIATESDELGKSQSEVLPASRSLWQRADQDNFVDYSDPAKSVYHVMRMQDDGRGNNVPVMDANGEPVWDALPTATPADPWQPITGASMPYRGKILSDVTPPALPPDYSTEERERQALRALDAATGRLAPISNAWPQQEGAQTGDIILKPITYTAGEYRQDPFIQSEERSAGSAVVARMLLDQGIPAETFRATPEGWAVPKGLAPLLMSAAQDWNTTPQDVIGAVRRMRGLAPAPGGDSQVGSVPIAQSVGGRSLPVSERFNGDVDWQSQWPQRVTDAMQQSGVFSLAAERDLSLDGSPVAAGDLARSWLSRIPGLTESLGGVLDGSLPLETKYALVGEALTDAAYDYSRLPEKWQPLMQPGAEGGFTFAQFAKPYLSRVLPTKQLGDMGGVYGDPITARIPQAAGELWALEALRSGRGIDAVLKDKVAGARDPMDALAAFRAPLDNIASSNTRAPYVNADLAVQDLLAASPEGSRLAATRARLLGDTRLFDPTRQDAPRQSSVVLAPSFGFDEDLRLQRRKLDTGADELALIAGRFEEPETVRFSSQPNVPPEGDFARAIWDATSTLNPVDFKAEKTGYSPRTPGYRLRYSPNSVLSNQFKSVEESLKNVTGDDSQSQALRTTLGQARQQLIQDQMELDQRRGDIVGALAEFNRRNSGTVLAFDETGPQWGDRTPQRGLSLEQLTAADQLDLSGYSLDQAQDIQRDPSLDLTPDFDVAAAGAGDIDVAARIQQLSARAGGPQEPLEIIQQKAQEAREFAARGGATQEAFQRMVESDPERYSSIDDELAALSGQQPSVLIDDRAYTDDAVRYSLSRNASPRLGISDQQIELGDPTRPGFRGQEAIRQQPVEALGLSPRPQSIDTGYVPGASRALTSRPAGGFPDQSTYLATPGSGDQRWSDILPTGGADTLESLQLQEGRLGVGMEFDRRGPFMPGGVSAPAIPSTARQRVATPVEAALQEAMDQERVSNLADWISSTADDRTPEQGGRRVQRGWSGSPERGLDSWSGGTTQKAKGANARSFNPASDALLRQLAARRLGRI